jgi:hypothetical protein
MLDADNRFRQYLLNCQLRKRAYRDRFGSLYDRVSALLRNKAATEAEYIELYDETKGLKRGQDRRAGGAPEKWEQALGASKVLRKDGLAWKDVYKRCKECGVPVPDDLAVFTRDMQRKMQLGKKKAT